MSHAMPTRRNVVRSAAWTVPVVATSVAVPAFAASPCATSHAWRLDWGNNTTNDAFTTAYSVTKTSAIHIGTATITGPAATSPVTVTFRNSVVGADRRHPTNLTVENTTDIGDLGAQERGLLLWNTNIVAGRDASRQVLEVTFSRSVSNLRFTITDVDSSGGYRDRVELSGDRTGVANSRGGGNLYVEGNGTAGAETSSTSGPWRMYANNVPANDSGDSRGNVAVTYNSPVTSFQLDYWNANGNGQQAIFLSDFTFDALGC